MSHLHHGAVGKDSRRIPHNNNEGTKPGESGSRAYDTAFSRKTALTDNSHDYPAGAAAVFGAAKLSLVQQGFEIEQVDAAEGLLKGMRTFDDPKNPQIAYLVSVTADVTEASPGTTVLTAATTGAKRPTGSP